MRKSCDAGAGSFHHDIDLNPVAAGIVKVPEASPHTSIKTRVEHLHAQNRADDLQAAKGASVAGSRASDGLEESLWLCPIEDRRRLDSSREGMLAGFSLGNYLLLVGSKRFDTKSLQLRYLATSGHRAQPDPTVASAPNPCDSRCVFAEQSLRRVETLLGV